MINNLLFGLPPPSTGAARRQCILEEFLELHNPLYSITYARTIQCYICSLKLLNTINIFRLRKSSWLLSFCLLVRYKVRFSHDNTWMSRTYKAAELLQLPRLTAHFVLKQEHPWADTGRWQGPPPAWERKKYITKNITSQATLLANNSFIKAIYTLLIMPKSNS